MMKNSSRFAIFDFALSLIVAIMIFMLLRAALGLPGRSGLFPRYIAGFAFACALVDIFLKGYFVFRHRKDAGQEVLSDDPKLAELGAMLWPVILVTLVYLLGFMLAIPVFMAIYFAFRRSIRFFTAFMIIAAFSSLSYLVFWVLLKVRFYGGILNLSLTSF